MARMRGERELTDMVVENPVGPPEFWYPYPAANQATKPR
jgi:hypothetical protein